MTIGLLLKQIRTRAGFSVVEAAALIPIHRVTLHTWESEVDPTKPSPESLRIYLDKLGALPEERDALARLIAFGAPAGPAAESP